MNSYWFIIGARCFKLGKHKKIVIVYCDSIELSESFMWQFIKNKSNMVNKKLIGVMKFEDYFKKKPNQLYNFICDEITIHVNKRMKSIEIFQMDYVVENGKSLEEFLSHEKLKWNAIFNLPMMYIWQKYIIIGYFIVFGLLIIIFSFDFVLPNINLDKKHEILSKL